MHLFTSAHESLAQTSWQCFGVTLSFGPLLALADEVGIDVSLVCEVVRYGAVDFFQTKKLEVLADSLRRLAAAECMDDRIERDSCPGNIIIAVPLIDVFLRYTFLILLRNAEAPLPLGAARLGA